MVSLADIPLVMPLAKWVWGTGEVLSETDEIPAFSAEMCLAQVPFFTSACFKQLLTKALGTGIILGSCLNKAPIMANMMNSRSAAGVARSSLYGDALVYACGVFYGFLEGHPFSAYGENFSLFLQTVVLVALAWQYGSGGNAPNGGRPSMLEQASAVTGMAVFVATVTTVLPASSRYLLISSTWPIMLYARGSQVLATYQDKHTGNLSIVTTSLNLVGATIRIGTTLQETGDMVVISGFVLSVALNFIMFVQHFLYLENTNKVMASAQDKKES